MTKKEIDILKNDFIESYRDLLSCVTSIAHGNFYESANTKITYDFFVACLNNDINYIIYLTRYYQLLSLLKKLKIDNPISVVQRSIDKNKIVSYVE